MYRLVQFVRDYGNLYPGRFEASQQRKYTGIRPGCIVAMHSVMGRKRGDDRICSLLRNTEIRRAPIDAERPHFSECIALLNRERTLCGNFRTAAEKVSHIILGKIRAMSGLSAGLVQRARQVRNGIQYRTVHIKDGRAITLHFTHLSPDQAKVATSAMGPVSESSSAYSTGPSAPYSRAFSLRILARSFTQSPVLKFRAPA